MKGNQITQNIVNRAESIIKKYYSNKGFGNAVVKINLTDDLSHPNEVIVDININKNDKVKVHKIYIDGNNVLSDRQLQRVMKKTNEKGKLINLFRQKNSWRQTIRTTSTASFRNTTKKATATPSFSPTPWSPMTKRQSTYISTSMKASDTSSTM